MTLSTHAIVGVLIAQWSGDPILGFFLALSSHYLLDMVPHGDEFVYWRYIHNKNDVVAKSVATVDSVILATLITLLLSYTPDVAAGHLILAGAIGGILPDLLITTESVVRRRKPKSGWLSPFIWLIDQHYRIHMFFHQLFFLPIRFRFALFIQLLALSLFVVYTF